MYVCMHGCMIYVCMYVCMYDDDDDDDDNRAGTMNSELDIICLELCFHIIALDSYYIFKI